MTDVTVDELHDLAPGLSATVVTVAVTVRTATTGDLRERLVSAPGVESVEVRDRSADERK